MKTQTLCWKNILILFLESFFRLFTYFRKFLFDPEGDFSVKLLNYEFLTEADFIMVANLLYMDRQSVIFYIYMYQPHILLIFTHHMSKSMYMQCSRRDRNKRKGRNRKRNKWWPPVSVVGADDAKSQRRIIVCARRCNVMYMLYINGRPPTPGTKMHNNAAAACETPKCDRERKKLKHYSNLKMFQKVKYVLMHFQ